MGLSKEAAAAFGYVKRTPRKFDTAILYNMVTGAKECDVSDGSPVLPVIQRVYPGLYAFEGSRPYVVASLVVPEIKKQYPTLAEFASAAEAARALGEKLPVARARERCSGFGWMYPKQDPAPVRH